MAVEEDRFPGTVPGFHEPPKISHRHAHRLSGRRGGVVRRARRGGLQEKAQADRVDRNLQHPAARRLERQFVVNQAELGAVVDPQRLHRRQQIGVEPPPRRGEPPRLEPGGLQHLDPPGDVAAILLQGAIGVVPITVASHVESRQPPQRLRMIRVGRAADKMAGGLLVASQRAKHPIEIDRIVLVVVDPQIQRGAVRVGKRRQANPDPAPTLDLLPQSHHQDLPPTPLVDPRNLLANRDPLHPPCHPRGLLVGKLLERIDVEAASQEINVNRRLALPRRRTGVAAGIEQQESPPCVLLLAPAKRHPLPCQGLAKPRRDVVQNQGKQGEHRISHESNHRRGPAPDQTIANPTTGKSLPAGHPKPPVPPAQLPFREAAENRKPPTGRPVQ